MCVFHVWLSALLKKNNQYANEYFWRINGIERHVTIGFPVGRGDLDIADYTNWQERWNEAMRSLKLTGGLHWASLCYVQQAGKFIACDALLDNNACESVKQEMQRFRWPTRKNFYSVRQFMIIENKNP
ncbi:MAG: DUF6348 family protein [Candidatus Melainabacteria bacterium]|nr:DUF6348 family protein [Candidatus Melainabacteria bacterium]